MSATGAAAAKVAGAKAGPAKAAAIPRTPRRRIAKSDPMVPRGAVTEKGAEANRLAVLCKQAMLEAEAASARLPDETDERYAERQAAIRADHAPSWAALWQAIEGLFYKFAPSIGEYHGVPFFDLMGDAYELMTRCVRGFNPDQAVFSTYFIWSMRQSLIRDVRHQRERWRCVALGEYAEINLQGREPDPSESSETCDLPGVAELVGRELAGLDSRERFVIRSRFSLGGVPKMTLVQLGKEMGISKERIRQIEERALRKLRLAIERQGWAKDYLGDE